MQKISSLALIILQWLLVLWGLLLILIALNTYAYEASYFSSLPVAEPGQDSYNPPVFQRMVTGVVSGLIAVGIGAVLFYLRKTFLRKRPDQALDGK